MDRRTVAGIACATAAFGLMLVLPYLVLHPDVPHYSFDARDRRTAAVLVAQSGEMARRILDLTGPLTFQVAAPGRGGGSQIWTTVCADPRGHELLRFTWRGGAHELVSISRVASPSPGTAVRDRPAAVRASWRWAADLGMAEAHRKWRTEGVRHVCDRMWGCAFRSGDRRAYIEVDGTAALMLAVASTNMTNAA